MSQPDAPQAALPRRRRSRSPLPWMVAIAAVIGVAGAAGVLRAADERTADVERIEGLETVLAEVPDEDDETIEYPAENYLLVGSDSRAGVDPDSPDFGAIGTVHTRMIVYVCVCARRGNQRLRASR